MSLHPYLTFPGNAREAMTHYQRVLGGQLDIMGVDDMPPDAVEEMPFDPAPGFVIHAALTFGDGELIMASDSPSEETFSGVSLNLTITDQDEARRLFEAFADGGEVHMPLGPTFWSPLFGDCTDRFGVTWMINVEGDPA